MNPTDDAKYPGFVRTEKEHREVYKRARQKDVEDLREKAKESV